MSHRLVVAFLASAAALAGCGKLADLAGVPNHAVASVTVVLPATILVGDTVQATAVLKDDRGRQPQGDTTVVWRSSDAGSVSVDSSGRVTSAVPGAHATITAQAGKVTGSVTVSVGDDQRLGYALADQPAATGPYSPDSSYRHNSAGGAIEVTRASPGVYSVRFAGLGRTSGQRDNVQVTGYGGAGGIFCKLRGWQTVGADLLADVRCFTVSGASADSRFTILLSGARVYNTSSRLGFVLSPDFGSGPQSVQLDTSGTTRNNSSKTVVNLGHNSTGNYSIQFVGLERTAGQGAETVQVTAVGPGPELCYLGAMDPATAGVNVLCTTTGGASADSRFSVMLFQRGRLGPQNRFAYARADRPTSTVDYTPNAAFARDNSGTTITARQLGTGKYQVVFGGLGKRPGDTETVLISAFGGDDACTTTSWGNTGTADLTVKLACFDPAGAPANTQFNILAVQ